MFHRLALTAALAACLALPAVAQQAANPVPERPAGTAAGANATVPAPGMAASGRPRVGITADMDDATWTTPAGRTVTISRDQTPGTALEGDWALTGRDCPPFCIQPMTPAPGVATLGELELIEAMKASDIVLVDGRAQD